jgi:hypothetical protein
MKTFVSGLALASLVSSAALAATTTAPAPAGSQTTATAESVAPAPKLIDSITASISGTFLGPSLAAMTGNDDNVGASQTSDLNGDVDKPINFEGAIAVGYKLTPSTKVSANMTFIAYPVRGEGVELLNPYLAISQSNMIKSGNYKLDGSMRVYAPTSEPSRLASQITAVRLIQSQGYSVGRWSLVMDTFIQGSFFGEDIQKKDAATGLIVEQNAAAQLAAYVAPSLSYQITPTLAAVVYYEAVARHYANSDLIDWKPFGTNLNPGVSWDITPKVNFNPFLQLNASRANTEAVVLGANLSASFL